MMCPKVSVIVPIYKVEPFIDRCVRSLMAQTLSEVEFIFVDDASPDHSAEILKQILSEPENSSRNWQILTHPQNLGLPAARNTGLSVAEGEYIYNCDSDDWLEPDMLERLYAAAKKDSADYAWCDFFISFESGERYMKARDYRSAEDLVLKGFLAGDMKYNVWNKLVSRSLYSDIDFPTGHPMGEDMTMILLAANAKAVTYVPRALYHYVKTNSGAYTQTISQKSLDDIKFNTFRTIEYLEGRFHGQYTKDLELFKLNVKLPFLISEKKEDYRRWQDWFPEANAYCFANTELPFRTKLLQWMAAHGVWGYVWLYNKIVLGFLYGLLFR